MTCLKAMTPASTQMIDERYQSKTEGIESVRLGVAVALIDLQGHLLLERRSDVGWWGITGGRLDVGETPVECGLREIYEETGLTLAPEDLTLLSVYGDPHDGRILQYPDCRSHLVDIVYLSVLQNQPQLRLSDESLELEFFSVEDLPNQIVPPARRPINDLIDRGLVK